ncbi:MAG: methionyl-tRNA formyltransferase [Hungatella sp.]|nr:methionyl-tRNA formyltransferase [Hungatella sp.]
MRIVFMGTPDFSVPVLEALAGSKHQVIAVVTQPDKPKGRGKAVVMTPVKEKAVALGIPVYQPAKVREPEFVQVLKDLNPDTIVVVAFGQILKKNILDLPPFGCVNVHASLLPGYRGSAPIQWAVINGEKESGVTTMMMDEGIDTGDMLEKASIPLESDETGGSLHDKLSRLGAELILSTLTKLEDGTLKRTPQTDENTCYARMLKKSMGDIDWTMDAVSIERLIRGLNPWPSAYTRWNQKTLKIWKAQVLEEEYEGVCGEVVCTDKSRILVKTGKGTLSLKELQPEGKKRMEVEAFLRGYPVELHTVFERSC